MANSNISPRHIVNPYLVLLILMHLPVTTDGAIHFGTGFGYYDGEYIYYNDKGFYRDFSTELGVYSDFKSSHMVFLNMHLYKELSRSAFGVTTIPYVGMGGIYIKDSHNYTHKNWGVRVPLGIELMTASGISLFTEVTPTFILSPSNEYETTNTFGIRYYFY